MDKEYIPTEEEYLASLGRPGTDLLGSCATRIFMRVFWFAVLLVVSWIVVNWF